MSTKEINNRPQGEVFFEQLLNMLKFFNTKWMSTPSLTYT